jgi:ABC-type multidrug transport system ATPase subunit
MARVVASNVSKMYAGKTVLHPVNFDIPQGILAVVGPNGSGKTTLLRRCAGLVAGGGSVTFDDVCFRHLRRPRQIVGVGLGYAHLDLRTTPRSLLRAHAVASSIRFTQVETVLHDAGLSAVANRRIARLSRGFQQRVSLALALLGRPSVLVLDEPEAGLDVESCRWLSAVLESHQGAGGTAIIATHEHGRLSLLPDYVLRLKRDAQPVLESVEDMKRLRVLVRVRTFPVDPSLTKRIGASSWTEQVDGSGVTVAHGLSPEEVIAEAMTAGAVVIEVRELAWHEVGA